MRSTDNDGGDSDGRLACIRRNRHRPTLSCEMIGKVDASPASCSFHSNTVDSTVQSLPSLYRRPAVHASRYPHASLTPELDKKMKLIAGYQLLRRLEITTDPAPVKLTQSPEAKKRPANTDSRDFLALKRTLLSSKRCNRCHKTYCNCATQVKDTYLSRMTRRFHRARTKLQLASNPPYHSSERRSTDLSESPYRIFKTGDNGYKIAFRTNPPPAAIREILSVDVVGKRSSG